jgi:hypothetical protein
MYHESLSKYQGSSKVGMHFQQNPGFEPSVYEMNIDHANEECIEQAMALVTS